jgi:hypothetical protein
VEIPAGLVVGEDPELDARRFRRTDAGVCLITQPMIDQLQTCGRPPDLPASAPPPSVASERDRHDP